MFPRQLVAFAAKAIGRILRDRRTDLLVQIRKPGHSAAQQRAHEDIEAPARMQHAVQHHAGAHLERHGECQPLQVLAVGAHAGVDGHDQHRDLGLAQTAHQFGDALDVAGQIGLIPAAIAGGLLQAFERHAGGAADDEGNPRLLGGARQRQVALVHDDRRESGGSEAHRHGVVLAKQADLAAALLDHAQAARAKADIAQGADAFVERRAVFRAAADVAFDAARHDAPRLAFEVPHRQATVQAAHAATGEPACSRSACMQAASERAWVSSYSASSSFTGAPRACSKAVWLAFCAYSAWALSPRLDWKMPAALTGRKSSYTSGSNWM
ncbi:hypothetical protein D3C87_1407010 [compost metagenome]